MAEADTRKKPVWKSLTTEVGTLKFPWLNKPDVGRKYSSGKFSTTIVFEPAEGAIMQERMDKLGEFVAAQGQAWEGKKKAPVLEPFLNAEIDKETEEPTGRLEMKLECEPRRQGKDGKITEVRVRFLKEIEGGVEVLNPEPQVWGGTKAKLEMRWNPLPVSAQGKNYVQRRLGDVLIIELQEGTGGRDESQSAFGKVVENKSAPANGEDSYDGPEFAPPDAEASTNF